MQRMYASLGGTTTIASLPMLSKQDEKKVLEEKLAELKNNS